MSLAELRLQRFVPRLQAAQLTPGLIQRPGRLLPGFGHLHICKAGKLCRLLLRLLCRRCGMLLRTLRRQRLHFQLSLQRLRLILKGRQLLLALLLLLGRIHIRLRLGCRACVQHSRQALKLPLCILLWLRLAGAGGVTMLVVVVRFGRRGWCVHLLQGFADGPSQLRAAVKQLQKLVLWSTSAAHLCLALVCLLLLRARWCTVWLQAVVRGWSAGKCRNHPLNALQRHRGGGPSALQLLPLSRRCSRLLA